MKDLRKEFNEEPFGEKVGHILSEIEDAIVDRAVYYPGDKPNYSNDSFKAALTIFLDVSMDKMWDYQERLKMPYDAREKAVLEYGKAIRLLIFRFCDIATEKL